MPALVVLPAAAQAGNIYLSDCSFGFHDPVYGIQEQVCVTGDLDCLDDWIFPVADIYIVVDDGRTWTSGMPLVEAMGAPNPVNGTGLGGAFYDVTIALPPLPLGRFDIIVDENQNGVFDSCNGALDTVIGNGTSCAFEVVDMGLALIIPTGEIKAQATIDAAKWDILGAQMVRSIQAVSYGLDAYRFGTTVASAVVGGHGLMVGIWNGVVGYVPGAMYGYCTDVGYEAISYLSRNVAEGHAALALDPPDPEYLQNVVLGPVDYEPAAVPGSVSATRAKVNGYLSEQSALLAAMLGSLEKFTGAAAVPDNRGVRFQALALRKYAGLWEDCVEGLDSALVVLGAEVDSMGFGSVEFHPDSSIAFRDRVASEGFLPQEIALMVQSGFETADIDSLEAAILRWNLDQVPSGSVLADLDSTVQSCRALLPVVEDVAAAARTAVDTTSLVWIPHPAADPGGPYAGDEGDGFQLDGSGSTDPGGQPLTYTWDLDGDGAFDDASGALVEHSWSREGDRLVGLKVTNPQGYFDVGYARVRVAQVDDGPGATSVSPEDFYIDMEGCEAAVFHTSAVDPEGAPVQFAWTLDDSLVSIVDHWTLQPSQVSPGRHRVDVVMSDGSPLSPDSRASWRVDVPSCEAGGVAPSTPAGGELHLTLSRSPGTASIGASFVLSRGVSTTLSVFDVTGRRVVCLFDGDLPAGGHRFQWDAHDGNGRPVPGGVYWFLLQTPGERATAKAVLVR